MNRLEASYAQQLEKDKALGNIILFEFESVKFSLGSGAWFCPDFMVMLADGTIEFHETKGFMREAANVRLKVAAEKYPFEFILVKRLGGQWQYTRI